MLFRRLLGRSISSDGTPAQDEMRGIFGRERAVFVFHERRGALMRMTPWKVMQHHCISLERHRIPSMNLEPETVIAAEAQGLAIGPELEFTHLTRWLQNNFVVISFRPLVSRPPVKSLVRVASTDKLDPFSIGTCRVCVASRGSHVFTFECMKASGSEIPPPHTTAETHPTTGMSAASCRGLHV